MNAERSVKISTIHICQDHTKSNFMNSFKEYLDVNKNQKNHLIAGGMHRHLSTR